MDKDKKKLPKGKSGEKSPIPQNGPKFQMKSQKGISPSMMRRGNSRGR